MVNRQTSLGNILKSTYHRQTDKDEEDEERELGGTERNKGLMKEKLEKSTFLKKGEKRSKENKGRRQKQSRNRTERGAVWMAMSIVNV